MGNVMPSSTSISLQTSLDGSASSSVPSGAIFHDVGSGGSVFLSNYVAAASDVALTVSFVVASALSMVPLKSVAITGVRFAALNASKVPSFCSNVNMTMSVNFTPLSGELLLNFSSSAFPTFPMTSVESFVHHQV